MSEKGGGGFVNKGLDLQGDDQEDIEFGQLKDLQDKGTKPGLQDIPIDNILEEGEEEENGVTFEDLEFEPNWITNLEEKISAASARLKSRLDPNLVKRIPTYIAFILFNIFFIWSLYHFHNNSPADASLEWCHGLGFLIILTLILYYCLIYTKVLKPNLIKFLDSKTGEKFKNSLIQPCTKAINDILAKKFANYLISFVLISALVIFLVIDTANDRRRLVSGLGLVVMIFLGWIISKYPGRVCWRHVLWGTGLQFIFGLAILRWKTGKDIFECLGNRVSAFLDFTDSGSIFVFGSLVSQKPFWTFALDKNSTAYEVATAINDNNAFGWIFMFKVLSVIYFFSFFISMLFYLGWMQVLVIKIGWVLQKTVGTTACESLNAAANIFLGQSEAPLMIKPYLPIMTNSEIHAVMTGGFATIAGSVLAAYISFGISASHLLSASVMSAPAALAMAKLVYPETKKTKTQPDDITIVKGQEANLLDAASQGAITAVFLVANIAGTLIAVLAFIAFLNGVLGWLGLLVGIEGLSFEVVLGKCFIPIAWVMGVPDEDLEKVGILLGLKTFVNEFAAYDRLAQFSGSITLRSKVISTYALCGFANPASIGIQIAALGTMAPTRQGDLARVAIRAFLAGSLACFMTACVAGMLIEE